MAFGLIIQRRLHVPLGWPECSGMGGRNGSEYPAGMDRNGWPESIGISGRNASEYALSICYPRMRRKTLSFSLSQGLPIRPQTLSTLQH
jgi:hypothetical protein